MFRHGRRILRFSVGGRGFTMCHAVEAPALVEDELSMVSFCWGLHRPGMTRIASLLRSSGASSWGRGLPKPGTAPSDGAAVGEVSSSAGGTGRRRLIQGHAVVRRVLIWLVVGGKHERVVLEERSILSRAKRIHVRGTSIETGANGRLRSSAWSPLWSCCSPPGCCCRFGSSGHRTPIRIAGVVLRSRR